MKKRALQGFLLVLAFVLATGCSAARTMLLLSASASGQTTTVERLIDEGVDINATDHLDNSALATAAREGHVETVRLLLSHGAYTHTKNKAGDTALSLAEKNGHAEVARLLREAGAEE